jgi:hypothetical protein
MASEGVGRDSGIVSIPAGSDCAALRLFTTIVVVEPARLIRT